MEKQQASPVGTHTVVWLALLVLTGITVTVSTLDLGRLSVLTAIAVAAVKSTLVIMFFMRIKYEDRVFKVMIALAVATLTVILLLTFIDVWFR
jgi:cytochrome c oxidase subunit 4